MENQRPESVGDRIRRLRIALDMSQEDLAQKVGVTGQAVSRLERGDSQRPQKLTLRGYATALETTAEYLLTGLEPTRDIYTEMSVGEFLRGHADLENPEHVDYLVKTWQILHNLERRGDDLERVTEEDSAGSE